ncbi:hypothetical protein [Pararhizobium polonicum]|jgi:hypothetical protein|uniref:hypothetical protein n=1 Tax=Pararhizobium polonicum TaxID=1612624 RepID=UPI000AFC51BB|nr:hypothetical protein [Pararhizobium polonicum]
MLQDISAQPYSPARQLRPVVVTVIVAELAVFALLMTTINFQTPLPAPVEIAEVR